MVLVDCKVVETRRGKRLRAVEVPEPVPAAPQPSPKRRRTASLSPKKPYDERGGGIFAAAAALPKFTPVRTTQGKVRLRVNLDNARA